jgi:hypothetical protein
MLKSKKLSENIMLNAKAILVFIGILVAIVVLQQFLGK